jgi:hypothetical protein
MIRVTLKTAASLGRSQSASAAAVAGLLRHAGGAWWMLDPSAVLALPKCSDLPAEEQYALELAAAAAALPQAARPCQPGLGDMLAYGLTALGVTPARVEEVIGGPCGCYQRQDAINEWGRSTLGIGTDDTPAATDGRTPTPGGPDDTQR